MNSMSSSPSGETRAVTPTVLSGTPEFQRTAPAVGSLPVGLQLGPRRVGFGLPCSKCRTYYAADLPACPVCKTAERVLPVVAAVARPNAAIAEPSPIVPALLDDNALEQERERFLREFAVHAHTEPVSLHCTLDDNHEGEVELATVCQSCYVSLQERVDLMEAALHMDAKEATQLVYNAVWSDPSDPSKTYQNAAQTLLSELRRRAGISAVLGSLQPLAH
jgi:hypothetical protein